MSSGADRDLKVQDRDHWTQTWESKKSGTKRNKGRLISWFIVD